MRNPARKELRNIKNSEKLELFDSRNYNNFIHRCSTKIFMESNFKRFDEIENFQISPRKLGKSCNERFEKIYSMNSRNRRYPIPEDLKNFIPKDLRNPAMEYSWRFNEPYSKSLRNPVKIERVKNIMSKISENDFL